MRILRAAITATVLALIWLVAFRIADLFTVFKTYSSVWFLPAGVTLAVVLAAPGWLKLVPLFAHLSLALPQVRQILHIEVASTLDALLHACRIYLIYGGIGLFLARRLGNHPYRGWVEVQWFLGASLIGVQVSTVFLAIWILSSVLATVAGVLVAPLLTLSPDMGLIGIKGFTAAVLGGFNSLPGAVIGGIVLGVLEALAGTYVSSALKDMISYGILIVVVLVRPQGLLGVLAMKKV